MRYLVSLLALALAGCFSDPVESDELKMQRAAIRLQVFKDCMELAAKSARQADDDVSDIVSACTTTAWSLSNQLILKESK